MSAYASPKLADSPKKWEGETVNEFPLRQYLGGRGGNAVFLSEYQRQKAAIKLITVDNKSFDAQLAYLTSLTTLSHPHLVRTFSAGKCKLDGEQRLYLISEFADEELSQVLPVRALTAEEGRQMLSAVVDALAYVHANGFVHGHVAPANVMVVAEQIKLSADPICRIGHRLRRRESNAYTAPEIDSDPASPAADIWSLGMTLVEALTQRLPSTSENDARIPGSIPEPLQQIARNCLRTKPEERCTTQLISALLSQPEAAVSPRKLSQRRAWLYTGTALAVAVLATTVAPKLFQHSAVESPAAATTAGASSSTASQPSPTLSRASATPATSGAGAVLHEVTPDVPKSARNTVHGVIKLRVRVNVDSDGNVTRTHLESAGPSKYFARLATQSAQQWKFTPPQQNGAAAPSEWRLHYEFTRAGARVEASPVRTAAR